MTPVLKQWFAFGSGIGIEVHRSEGKESLRVAAVRVRPNGATVSGGFTIEDFQNQPAADWGSAYNAFIGEQGLRHVAATVLLPRNEVIVRQLSMPGVSAKDLPGAVEFQMEGLHPYQEGDVVSSWARLQDDATVLVAIVRRTVIEHYITRFAEAGVKIGCFTCSAAAVYSALRVFGKPAPTEILACDPNQDSVEIYGESPAKSILSATFAVEPERAAGLAAAELRLETSSPMPLADLLGVDPALPYAAALTSACPRLSLPVNLLPPDQRQTNSPMTWIPATVLGSLVLLLAGAAIAFPKFEDRRYLRDLDAEIKKVQPAAARATSLDAEIDAVRKRTFLLDNLRRRTKSDLDSLAEMTRLLQPPTWLNMLEITPQQVMVGGEADEAEPLLKVIDGSPLFEGSEFISQPHRITSGWGFQIRTNRSGGQP
jgi:hypothetical protein